jgi:ABC-type glycerol-3-phosphate transport system substrate-binding protein
MTSRHVIHCLPAHPDSVIQMRTLILSLALVVLLAACGSDDVAVTTSTTLAKTGSSQGPTTTAAPTTSTTAVGPTTTNVPDIDVEFRAGDVFGADRVRVDLGEPVDIWVRSDVDDEIHVHGYDLYYDLVADEPLSLSFVADVPGIFEVEVHTGHTLLFELEVAG